MLRPPVLMRSIRRGRRRISKNIRRRFSKNEAHGRKKKKTILPSLLPSITGDEKKVNVDIQIAERKARNRSPECVFYKDDRERFQRRYTLKLKTYSEYNVMVEVEPAVQLSYVKLGGKKHETVEVTTQRDKDTKTIHTFLWSTKRIKTTESKYRTIFPCVVKFKGGEEIQFELMVKFYSADDVVRCSGTPMSSISLDVILGRSEQEMYDVTYN